MSARASYSLFMLLALLVFVVVRHFVPKPAGHERLTWVQRCMLALAAFIGGNLGAKLPFVPSHPDGPFALASWFSDGKTITMGLVGAYLAFELAKLVMGVRIKTGDSFALPLALAMAVGRWGCFFNGCCYGTPSDLPWAVAFDMHGESVNCHPTQIYESVFHLGMAAILLLAARLQVFEGQRLKFYLIAYAVFRFLVEWIRPEPVYWAGLTFYQLVSVGMAAGLAVQWVYDRRQAKELVPRVTMGLEPRVTKVETAG